MRRILTLALTALLVVLVGAGTAPTEAAKKKVFTRAFTCGTADIDDYAGLMVDVGAGHWTDKNGRPTSACGSRTKTWHPTSGAFTATVRWYAGSKVVKKQTRAVSNKKGPSRFFEFYSEHYGIADDGSFTYDGKPVKVTVTLSKKGYRSKVLTRRTFTPVY